MSARPPAPAETTDRLSLAAQLLGERARTNEPLGRRTTYRVGGNAALFAVVDDEDSLAATVEAVRASGVDVLVLGNGSNLLVADAGYDGLVVALGGSFASLRIDTQRSTVVAGGAVAYPVLARRCAAAGLTGMEWAVGIPGSIGGAVRMNAGGHGSSTSDRLLDARLVDLASGEERTPGVEDLGLSYRRSNVVSTEIVLEASFACVEGERSVAEAELSSIVRWRLENQPGGRNAGSVFSNPAGDTAGRLIEHTGLKGFRIGTAEVSTKHANFIQVDADGLADDVIRLIEHVRGAVAAATGTVLDTELRIVGRAA